jgi:hypothetical protein
LLPVEVDDRSCFPRLAPFGLPPLEVNQLPFPVGVEAALDFARTVFGLLFGVGAEAALGFSEPVSLSPCASPLPVGVLLRPLPFPLLRPLPFPLFICCISFLRVFVLAIGILPTRKLPAG